MIKLYIGGAYQGQNALAQAENPQAEIVFDFERLVRGQADAAAFAAAFCDQHPDAVITAQEIGCGIVPMDAEERAWREAAGRALCVVAQRAGAVVRVLCGVGVRIK